MTTATPYVAEWEADVVVSDGGVVHLRPTGPDDTEALRQMHSRMSAQTLYLRYFSAVGTVSDRQLAVYTEVDGVDSVGLVAELGGRLIAAGTYHRSPGEAAAEVAFVVQDDQQRRGLGSILLEHLAAAARERGLRRFTAEVLAGNTTMLRVFTDAGYTVRREYDEGVLEVEFDIAPSDASQAVMYSRERRSEARSLERLLTPRSVAVVGASDDPADLGHAVLANLRLAGFTGAIWPIHPNSVVVQGLPAYPNIREIPGAVDLAVIADSAGAVDSASAGSQSWAVDLVAQCADKGAHGLVVLGGVPGETTSGRLVEAARARGMRVLGPHSLGLMNTDPEVRLNATVAGPTPQAGRVGLFCHSAALGIALLGEAAERGVGVSTYAAAGNRADVSGNDLIQFWHDDPRTDVVVLYLESFGNARKFARLARALARRKPVIALKSGRHAVLTPGLVGSSSMVSRSAVSTLFAQAGVTRVDTVAEAIDVAALCATQPLPAGDRVIIIGNSSALGVLALDACVEHGLRVVEGGPVDLGVAVSPEALVAALDAAVGRADVDAVVLVYVLPVAAGDSSRTNGTNQALSEALNRVASTRVPVLAAVLGSVSGPSPVGDLSARGTIPTFRTPERAVTALAHAVRYTEWRSRPAGEVQPPEGADSGRARTLVDGWRADHPGDRTLSAAERRDLLACYGIEQHDFRVASTADEAVAAAADIGFPVAVKTAAEDFRHRDDRVGVRLGLNHPDEVRVAFTELVTLAGPPVYVQAMAPRDRSTVSTVLGVTADPSFGALVSFGLGGMATELLDDRAYRAVPLTDVDAADLIAGPRAAPLLNGYRGSAPVDVLALADLAQRLSALADDLPEVLELWLRPVLAGPAGITVTGSSARIGAPPRWQDDTRRMRRG